MNFQYKKRNSLLHKLIENDTIRKLLLAERFIAKSDRKKDKILY